MSGLGEDVLAYATRSFAYRRGLVERAIAQVPDDALCVVPGPDMSSIDAIMRHMAGNLRSRFTDFLESDGEKPWRHRDREFDEDARTRAEILADWESGWSVLEATLAALEPKDLERTVTVRGEPHTVFQAIARQLTHHSHHVGQIVLLARQHAGDAWMSLSVPRGQSDAFNRDMGHTP